MPNEWYEINWHYKKNNATFPLDDAKYLLDYLNSYEAICKAYIGRKRGNGDVLHKGELLLFEKLQTLIKRIKTLHENVQNPYYKFYINLDEAVSIYANTYLKFAKHVTANKNFWPTPEEAAKDKNEIKKGLKIIDNNMGEEMRKVLEIIRKEKKKQFDKRKK